jgi:hypothetical protein
MTEVTEKGIKIFGFTVPWEWADGIICSVIKKGDAETITEPIVGNIDAKLQEIVDNTKFRFDNEGKAKLEKAFTMSMVKKFMPELLQNP